jgi:hypothetical protein
LVVSWINSTQDDALNCAANMAIEHRFGSHTLIVPETVDRLCFCPSAACLRHTHSRFGTEGFYDIYQTSIQALVA